MVVFGFEFCALDLVFLSIFFPILWAKLLWEFFFSYMKEIAPFPRGCDQSYLVLLMKEQI